MNIDNKLKEKLNAVEKALQKYALKTTGNQLTSVKVLDVICRPFSDSLVLQADFTLGSRKLVMKSPIHHPVNKTVMGAENQAEVEFNILSRLYPKFLNIKGYGVPQPVLVIPEIETFVMEFVEGEMLVDRMRAVNYFASRKDFERLQQDYFNCGQWLRHFQESTGIRSDGPAKLEGIIERCDQQLTLIEKKQNNNCPRNLKSDVLMFVREQQRKLGDSDVHISGRHGDFGAWNIITGNDGITVIDYLGFKDEPIEVDLLKMMINFNNEEKALRSSKARIGRLRKVFLEGYGAIQNVSDPVLKICEAYHRAASLESVVNSKAFRFHRALEGERRFKANLNWLMYDRGEKTMLLNNM